MLRDFYDWDDTYQFVFPRLEENNEMHLLQSLIGQPCASIYLQTEILISYIDNQPVIVMK